MQNIVLCHESVEATEIEEEDVKLQICWLPFWQTDGEITNHQNIHRLCTNLHVLPDANPVLYVLLQSQLVAVPPCRPRPQATTEASRPSFFPKFNPDQLLLQPPGFVSSVYIDVVLKSRLHAHRAITRRVCQRCRGRCWFKQIRTPQQPSGIPRKSWSGCSALGKVNLRHCCQTSCC